MNQVIFLSLFYHPANLTSPITYVHGSVGSCTCIDLVAIYVISWRFLSCGPDSEIHSL